MKAVVLVGGLGTRLRPLTLRTPKQMLPVAGRPMIEWVVEHLAEHGVDEVVLSLGYRPDAFQRAYPDGTCAGVRLVYAVESEPLDTAGAIGFAAREAGIDQRFVVVNGDVLSDLDLSALVEFHTDAHDAHGALASVSLTPVDDPSAYGAVSTDSEGRVQTFVEKPASGAAAAPAVDGTQAVNAGCYVLEPEVLTHIPEGGRVNLERETFPTLVAAGQLWALRQDGWWIDVGTPERYLQATLHLIDGAAADGAASGDGVRPVAPSAMVATSAVVTRSTLGPGCRIGRNARVEDSIVFSRAVIGNGAVVSSSIVGASAVVGDAASVTALSVLGNDTEVEGGTAMVGGVLPDPATWPTS